ncbi:tail protein [Oceanobacillus picturae]|uniref:Tail protein n=2 Tax=Oceanobacillus picturae TaxID=171693 RepID=A0A0U9HDM5_9BACI|nr:tail protein [Oceanobacillus picturae]
MCYHLDIYRSITNDRLENLRKEANGNRRMNDNEVIDWWIRTNMLFILFFQSGKG